MISVMGRSGNLASTLKTTSTVVNSANNSLAATVVLKKPPPVLSIAEPEKNSLPGKSGLVTITSGIRVSNQVRFAHTDLRVPDFSDVRRTSTLDPTVKTKDTTEARQGFTYLIAGASVMAGAYSAKAAVTTFVGSMSASADVLALATIEIKLDKIPEGKSMTFKWRGKPVFVKHRTDAEISTEDAVDVASLRDPQKDSERVVDPKYLVVIGVCTHLGCVPIADAGDFGGYYCPCHGSHYDGSGRIRKGPAPLNLEVPEHSYPEPGVLVVG